jgi:hypothetical protein
MSATLLLCNLTVACRSLDGMIIEEIAFDHFSAGVSVKEIGHGTARGGRVWESGTRASLPALSGPQRLKPIPAHLARHVTAFSLGTARCPHHGSRWQATATVRRGHATVRRDRIRALVERTQQMMLVCERTGLPALLPSGAAVGLP